VQWQSSTNGTTWNDIAGATSPAYSFTTAAGDNAKQYRAVFTNSAGNATTSSATLTVNVDPAVTTQPASTTVLAGATATFTAAASGTPTPTVQWQSSPNGLNWSNIGGATSASYSFTTAAGKPRRSALRRVLADLELPHGQVALVGDRLFTDVLAGNRLGLFTVLVKPVDAAGQPCQRDRLQATEVRLARWLGAELH
jgi:hypothetical protein